MGKGQVAGYLLAIGQAILYASMGVIGKFLYGTGVTPEQVTVLRFIGAVVIVGAAILIGRRGPLFSRRPLVYLQALFFAASAYLFMLAVDMLTAGLATVIFYTYPAVVAVLAAAVLHERITPISLVALVLAMTGVFLISGVVTVDEITLSPEGIAVAVAACISFAIYTVIGQKTVSNEGRLTSTFTMSAVTAVLAIAVFPGEAASLVTLDAWQLALGFAIALLCTALPIPMLLAAIKRVGAAKASLVSILETPFSLLLAFIALGETLTPLEGAGAVLVVASIIVTTVPDLIPAKQRG